MSQHKNIIKTVCILVVIMTTIVLLFINKITTPRYLSNIELKINGLNLLEEKVQLINDADIQLISNRWVLVAQNEKDKEVITNFLSATKKSVRKKITSTQPKNIAIAEEALPKQAILLINPQGQWVAYLKPPYNQHKMLLTLSSVITHRQ